MDLLQSTDLVDLAAADQGPACVSLFMSTHRSGAGVKADRIAWRNLVDGAQARLGEAGLAPPEVEAVLAPARDLHEDALEWQYMSDGLVMYLRPGWHRTFRVPLPVGGFGVVGDRFVLGPLARLLGDDAHFLLLAIGQSHVALWEGTRHGLDEVVLPDIPASLRDVVEPAEPRSDTMARPAARAGRGGPAIFYGHGASDDQFKQNELVRFVRQVAAGLAGFMAAQDLPVVLVGLEPTLSVYRAVSGEKRLLADEVRRSPDSLSPDELHAAAWPLVQAHTDEALRLATDAFARALGTGLASSDPQEVADAATAGRVDTLFLAGTHPCWDGAPAGATPVIRIDDPAFAACVRMDRAALDTVNRQGRVLLTEGASVPGDSGVAALFRF